MDKSKIAMVPFTAVGVFASGWYGGREFYEHHQISDAKNDLAAAEALPRDDKTPQQAIPPKFETKVNEIFGKVTNSERVVVNRDGVLTFVNTIEKPQADYKTIVNYFTAQKEHVVDGQGDFAMLTGEISLGVAVLAGVALAVHNRRKHNRLEPTTESGAEKQPNWLHRKLGSLTTIGSGVKSPTESEALVRVDT